MLKAYDHVSNQTGCLRKSMLSHGEAPLSAEYGTRISAGAKSKVKSSVQRGIKTQIVETYPLLTPVIDDIIPKKSQLDLLKL